MTGQNRWFDGDFQGPEQGHLTRLSSLKGTLATTFGAAADAYHSAADVQREVASRLARRISRVPVASHPRVLEIGCGTGFLHRALAPDHPKSQWLLTDLSEPMVRHARAGLRARDAHYAVMDGEQLAVAPGSFDLICASLVFQWFEDLPGSLKSLIDLLAPGGVLAFSTLTAESFPEWRAAHLTFGMPSAMRNYPPAEDIAKMIPEGLQVALETESIPRAYRNATAFLTHWKEIGTHVPDASRPPLTPGTMRKLLRRFEGGITVTYDVAYATIIKP